MFLMSSIYRIAKNTTGTFVSLTTTDGPQINLQKDKDTLAESHVSVCPFCKIITVASKR